MEKRDDNNTNVLGSHGENHRKGSKRMIILCEKQYGNTNIFDKHKDAYEFIQEVKSREINI